MLGRHLSCIDELSPNQFLVNIIGWGRALAVWQGNIIEPKRKERAILAYQPKITITTPVFGSGGGCIKKTLESVNQQSYQQWELYLLIDKESQVQLSKLIWESFGENREIKIKWISGLEQNLSDALNEVLNDCEGEFIGFLSGSDQLAKNALFEVVNLLNQHPDADVIYSDEAAKDNETLIHLFYKPDWSSDLFLSMNYLRNFVCCRAEMIRAVGGFRGSFEDDIKYDLILRIMEKTGRIHHIPKVLYDEQVPKNAYPKLFTADYSFELHKKSLRKHIKRVGIQAKVYDGIFKGSFRVRRKIMNQSKVSIIIPTRDKSEELQRCIESIECKTTYRNYEIIVVNNGSTQTKLLQYLKASPHKVIEYPDRFNFSKINNLATQNAKGKYLLFLNDDTQVISPGWLEAMVEHAQREEVGIVGAKLLYPNGLIQHAGMIVESNRDMHIYRFTNFFEHGYYGMADVVRSFNAVTGACLMIRKNVFQEVGGFEENLATIFNDIDLCLKVRSRGYLIIYTPYAILYHYEGISRWSDIRKEAKSFKSFYSRWNTFADGEIYFNPNCSSNIQSQIWINPYDIF